MKTIHKISPKVWVAVAAVVIILAAAIGFVVHGKLTATTMNLMKTEGTVDISNEKGSSITPKENLKLYSGYGVGTETVSYAWINLDDVKLIKMDESSEIEIQKDGKKLEILLNSGSLFFNVKEPLADDETMTIRTSTMMVGIRGTCGWVVSNGEEGAQVYILEGTVEAEATGTGETVQVSAGEMAEVTVNENSEVEISVLPFTEEFIAPFVQAELEDDADLSAAVLTASGLDALNPPDPVERLRTEYEEIIAARPLYDVYVNDGLSDAFYVDFDQDGTNELVLISREAGGGMELNFQGRMTKLEVYGTMQGHAEKYDELIFNVDDMDPLNILNGYELYERGGQTYIYLFHAWQTQMGYYIYTLEDGHFSLVEDFSDTLPEFPMYQPEYAQYTLIESVENLCPDLPSEVQQRNAFLGVLSSDFSRPVFAKLTGEGEDTALYLLDAFDGDGVFYKYTWNGTEIEYSELESDIIYTKLIDMDQDGNDELLLIESDSNTQYSTDHSARSAHVYSLNGTSGIVKVLDLDYSGSSNYPIMDVGLYRDTISENIYLGAWSDWIGVVGERTQFNSLTDYVDLIYDYSNPGGGVTIEDQTRIEEGNERRWEEYQAQLARFELIESIDLSGDNSQTFAQVEHTVEEVRQQLLER